MDSNEYCALVGGANGSFLVYPLDSAMCCMLYTKVSMQSSLKWNKTTLDLMRYIQKYICRSFCFMTILSLQTKTPYEVRERGRGLASENL